VVLAFSDDPERRALILRFASWLEGESGFTTAVRIVEGEGSMARRAREEAEKELSAEIRKGSFPAFARAVAAPDIENSLPVILQAHGLGTVRPNTIILNWLDSPFTAADSELRTYGGWLRLGLRFGCNVIILATASDGFSAIDNAEPAERRIDVWHRDNATGRLNLLLAYLMTRTQQWREARIRLLVPVGKDNDEGAILEETARMLAEARIDAEPEIVTEPDEDTVIRYSADASLIFMPFRLAEQRATSVFGGSLEDLLDVLGPTALVLAAQDIVLDSEPEEGVYAEISEAVDEAEKTRKAAEKAEAAAAAAATAALEIVDKIKSSQKTGIARSDLMELLSAARQAQRAAEVAKRRAVKARTKADTAEEEAETITGQPAKDDKEPEADS
jgi:hypothetical protein